MKKRNVKETQRTLPAAVYSLGLACWFLISGAWPAGPNPAPEGVAKEELKAGLPPGVACVPFRIYGNRIFIPIRLNDKTDCEAVVDTGAEVTLLNTAKVKVDGLRYGGMQRLEGAFVGSLNAQDVTLHSLAIDLNKVQNLKIGAIHHGAGQVLNPFEFVLGMDFLSRFRFSLDFPHSRFLIWPRGVKIPEAGQGVQRATISTHTAPGEASIRPRIFGMINGGTRVSWLLDTGADGPTFAALEESERKGFEPLGRQVATLNAGANGQKFQLPVHEVTYKKLSFGPAEFQQVPGRLIDATQIRAPSVRSDIRSFNTVLGTPFLKNLQALHIDIPARQVQFDYLPALLKSPPLKSQTL